MTRLNEGIGYLLWQLQHQVQQRLEQEIAPLRLGLAQVSALSRLAEHPGLSSADLARYLLRTPQAVSLMIGRLEAAGYLVREEEPGRRRALHPTDAGRAAVRTAEEAVGRVHREFLAGLGPDEQVALRDMLTRALATATTGA